LRVALFHTIKTNKIQYVKNLLGIIEQNLLNYINNSTYLRIEDYLYELTLKEVLESPVPLDTYYNYWGSKPIYNTKNTFRTDKTENNEYNRLAGLVADRIIKQLKFSKDSIEIVQKYINALNSDDSTSEDIRFFWKLRNLLKHSEDYHYFNSIKSAVFFNWQLNDDYKEMVSNLNNIIEQIKKFGDASITWNTANNETIYKQLKEMIPQLATFMVNREIMMENPDIEGIVEPIKLIGKLNNLFWEVRDNLDSYYDKGDGDLEKYYNEVHKEKKSRQS
jgi:hypothetical protein